MRYHGRLTDSEARAHTLMDGGTHLWRVTSDPSNMFLQRAFRITDLHADGVLLKMQNVKNRKRKKKMVYAKPARHRSANATL